MAKLTHPEFDRQVEEAMNPPPPVRNTGFSPDIRRIRQTASKRRPQGQGKQLPIAR